MEVSDTSPHYQLRQDSDNIAGEMAEIGTTLKT